MNIYERWKLFKANPCDVDAAKWLKPLGRALAWLGTACPCCNGFRVLAAFLAGALVPHNVLLGLAAVWLVALGWAYIGAGRADAGE